LVLLLVVSVFLFAIYLKVWAPISSSPLGDSPTQVKFWVKSAAVQNSKLKLATTDCFVFIALAAVALVQRNPSFSQPIVVSRVPLKDAFAETTYWFRPPPRG
jgi:hypothetical protein